jgi:hypothetical protein
VTSPKLLQVSRWLVVVTALIAVTTIGLAALRYGAGHALDAFGGAVGLMTRSPADSGEAAPPGSVVLFAGDTVAVIIRVKQLSGVAQSNVLLFEGNWTSSTDGVPFGKLGGRVTSALRENVPIRIRLLPADSLPKGTTTMGLRVNPGGHLFPVYVVP